MSITHANLLQELTTEVPDSRWLVQEHLREYDGDLLVHLLMWDLLQLAVESFHSDRRELSRGIVEFVDRALRTGDEAIQNAVAVSFVEHAGLGPGETAEFIDSWPEVLRTELSRQNRS